MAYKNKLTIREVLQGVGDTLESAIQGVRVDTLESMTEGIGDTPLIQVYFDSIEADIASDSTDRSTFRAGVRQTNLIINVDVYAKQRADIGEDMLSLVDMTDAVIDVFDDQQAKPYFNVDGLKGFRYQGERVVFEYGQARFLGVRFSLTFRIF